MGEWGGGGKAEGTGIIIRNQEYIIISEDRCHA